MFTNVYRPKLVFLYFFQHSCIFVKKSGKFNQEKAEKQLAYLKSKNIPVSILHCLYCLPRENIITLQIKPKLSWKLLEVPGAKCILQFQQEVIH